MKEYGFKLRLSTHRLNWTKKIYLEVQVDVIELSLMASEWVVPEKMAEENQWKTRKV